MSVNGYLNDLAQRAIVRDNEKNKIQVSIDTIFKRLQQFDESSELSNSSKNQINDYFVFGSYKRGTIISRQFDDNSDVDIMIIFKDNTKKPQTYLNYLKSFAESKYPQSLCRQSFPAVVLELNHIKFDLVPAIIDDFGDYKIPNRGFLDWIATNPNDLDKALVNNQTLRRLVRVAKIWNANQGYIYESYELEKWIVQQCFYGDLSLSEYFYRFCNLLPINYNLSQENQKKILRLKKAAKEAQDNDEYCIKGLFE